MTIEPRDLDDEDVRFVRGDDRIRRLAERPDLAAGVARIRASMNDADRADAMDSQVEPRGCEG